MWTSKQTVHASSVPLPITPKSSESNPELGTAGNISGNEELRIEGAVAEPISLKCVKLTVGKAARVNAEVVARHVIVYGQLFGNLRAGDRIEIKKDAVVIGDLIAARVVIEDGGYFKGNVQIERRKKPRSLPERATTN